MTLLDLLLPSPFQIGGGALQAPRDLEKSEREKCLTSSFLSSFEKVVIKEDLKFIEEYNKEGI